MQSFPVRRLSIVTMLSLCVLMIPAASAEPLKPKISKTPETYGEAMFGISEVRENVATVQCGGWDPNSNATAKNGKVTGDVPLPVVTGIPGRANSKQNALAKADTGMAARGPFEYPGDAYGFVSACDTSLVNGIDDSDLAKFRMDIKMREDGTVFVEDGNGHIDINPFGWCLLSKPEFATPKYCKMLYNAWVQMRSLVPPMDPWGPMFCNIQDPGWRGAVDLVPPTKEFCFDAKYTYECRGDACRTIEQGNQCNTVKQPGTFVTRLMECHIAIGEDGNPFIVVFGGDAGVPKPSSFYRHYVGSFTDVPPPANASVESPTKTWKIRGDCYDYYREDDPKDCVTDVSYDQCELTIATPDEQKPDTPEWPNQGDHNQKGNVTYEGEDATRPGRTVPDPWVADSATSLILIDTDKLKEIQQGFTDPQDILPILGTPLPVRQIAGKATTPAHGLTDMFDDSDTRAMSSFWEAQQKELLKMTEDPTTKLIMPARSLVGLADDDPLFRYVRESVTRPDGTVELTVRAGPDDIGNVLTSLMRVFVAPVQEVRIPLIVPLVSVAEIDARIFDWEQWKEREIARFNAETKAQEEGRMTKKPQPSQAEKADDLIKKLKKYKEDIGKVRLLRNALANYTKKLLKPEEQVRGYIADWYKQNALQLQKAAERSVQRRELKTLWRQIQQAMLVTDECQLLWCSNQRYSLPVFSLLDQWWGDKNLGAGAKRNHQYKPEDLRDLHYELPKDQEFDFSRMFFPRDPLLVPVLWPVQARIKLPVPPLVGGNPPDVTDFPDLPWIPPATILDDFPVPTVTTPPVEKLKVPTLPDLTEAIRILQVFRQIVGGGEQEAAYDRGSMQGVYCRFPQSVTIPPDLDKGNLARIVHVENDLKERTERLFARWMPNRQEDFAGRAARLEKQFVAPAKPSCREDILCAVLLPEEWRSVSWQWFAPFFSPDFSPLMKELEAGSTKDPAHAGTLPTDEAGNPYAASLDQLKRVFDGLPLPTLIDLLVPRRQ